MCVWGNLLHRDECMWKYSTDEWVWKRPHQKIQTVKEDYYGHSSQ